MKIMLVAIGTAGDVFPFIGLGQSLGQQGHEIHLLSLGAHRSCAESAGLVFHQIPGVEGVSNHPNFYHPTQCLFLFARQVLLPSLRPVYETVSSLDHREWIVISDQVSFGARVASEQQQFPLTTCIVSPFMLRSVKQLPVMPGKSFPAWAPHFAKQALMGLVSSLWDRELVPSINQFRKGLGVAPGRDIIYNWSLSTERVVGLFPEWFARRAPDWPKQFAYGSFSRIADASQNDDLQSLDIEDRSAGSTKPRMPVIAFCAGSAGSAGKRFFETAITASSGRSWRSLLVAPKCIPDGILPSNVTKCGFVPLATLLPKVDAIVHHGGLGTISYALASGVPQIVMPFGHDQFDNAHRLQRLGAATTLTGGAQSPSSVANSIEATLRNSEMLEQCSALSRKLTLDDRENQATKMILSI